MLFFNDDRNKPINIFFLKEEHFAFITANKIPIDRLRVSLYYDANREDLLGWISYQRFMENKLFGRKMTTYDKTPPIDIATPLDAITQALLTRTYEEVKYYEDSTFFSYQSQGNSIIVLGKNNTVLDNGFKAGQSDALKTVYQALLHTLGYYQLYFRHPTEHDSTRGITLAELIAKGSRE